MHNRTSALRNSAVISMSAAVLIFVLAGCGGGSGNGYGNAPTAAATPSGGTTAAAGDVTAIAPTLALTLTSDGFTNNGTIPAKYSCAGEGKSPALAWSGAPAGTKAFALIVHDPDAPLAGGFTHWLVINLSATMASLPPGIFQDGNIARGAEQLIGYRGMCPPVGASAHHYHFRLYALDAPIAKNPAQTRENVEAAMQGHILAQTDLVGLFGR